jgi:formylmethanofuran dehydrogenase subunit E
MATFSDEYCSRCGEQVAAEEVEFYGGVKLVCLDCGNVLDIMFDEDGN